MTTDFRCPGCEQLARHRRMIPSDQDGIYVGLVPWIEPEEEDEDEL